MTIVKICSIHVVALLHIYTRYGCAMANETSNATDTVTVLPTGPATHVTMKQHVIPDVTTQKKTAVQNQKPTEPSPPDPRMPAPKVDPMIKTGGWVDFKFPMDVTTTEEPPPVLGPAYKRHDSNGTSSLGVSNQTFGLVVGFVGLATVLGIIGLVWYCFCERVARRSKPLPALQAYRLTFKKK